MDLRKLSFFLAVIDHGTFTKAATAQFVSQPGLSQGIRELEHELGAALFDRIGRRVHLTDAGRALETPAREAVRQIENAVSAVSAVRGIETGRLDLVCLPTLASDPTAALIGAFRAEHRGIKVFLADPDDPDELLMMVRSGVSELGITERSTAIDDAMVVCAMGEQRLRVIFPPSVAVGRRALDANALSAYEFVVTPPHTSLRTALDQLLASNGHRTRVALETSQREAIVPLVIAGAGAALVTDHTARWAEKLGAQVRSCSPDLKRDIVLIHRDQPLSPAGRAFKRRATTPK
jgi:LysR family transcriptional regulator, carnitine catabolism transcriptional activator